MYSAYLKSNVQLLFYRTRPSCIYELKAQCLRAIEFRTSSLPYEMDARFGIAKSVRLSNVSRSATVAETFVLRMRPKPIRILD